MTVTSCGNFLVWTKQNIFTPLLLLLLQRLCHHQKTRRMRLWENWTWTMCWSSLEASPDMPQTVSGWSQLNVVFWLFYKYTLLAWNGVRRRGSIMPSSPLCLADINKFLWMVRIGGSTDKGRHIKEADYFTPQGEFRVDREGSPILLNCLMYKMCYYRFGQVYTEQGQ